MEDGILTDGKGRTVNFKNTIIVMTSNIGSNRILESANRFQVQKSLDQTGTVAQFSPEEAVKKLQSDPRASSILTEAASDPDIMDAVRAALSGSRDDLIEASSRNPAIVDFLQRVWAAVEAPESVSENLDALDGEGSSGLRTIRASIEASGVLEERPVHEQLYSELMQVVKEELEAKMKPELLNRIDEIIVFSPLRKNDLNAIAQLIIAKTLKRAEKEQDMILEVEQCIVDQIVHEGSAKGDQFGARPIRRAVQRYVEDSLSDAIIQGFLTKNDHATLELIGLNQVRLTRKRDGESLVVQVERSGGIDSGFNAASDAFSPSVKVNGAAARSSKRSQPLSQTPE